MNSETEGPSLKDVKKCLQEADSYDSTLNEQEMLELYHVLQDSQKTATQEDEQRRIFEQTEANCSIIGELQRNRSLVQSSEKEDLQSVDNEATSKSEDVVCSSSEEDMQIKKNEKPFIPKTWSEQKKQTKPVSDSEDHISSTSTFTKDTQEKQSEEADDVDVVDIVDVFNSIPTTHKPLKRITIIPKYSPPFYCNPKITNFDYKQRAHLISNYHLELLKKYNSYQRQSIFPAPWGKAIQSNSRFNGSLVKKNEKAEETIESSQENVGADEFPEAMKDDKGSEEEFELYVSQSGRHTKRKLYTENDDANEWIKRSKRTVKDEKVTKKNHPKKRELSTLSKEEITKRSKLFSDNANTSRTEKIFDKVVENDIKKKEAERELEKFHETLNNLSGEEDEEDPLINVAELVHSEEPFIRRRIEPPSGVKRSGTAGKNKTVGRPRSKKNALTKNSSSENSSQQPASQKYDPLDTSVSTTAGSVKEKAPCPVCFEEFFRSELLEHTPACLDSNNQNSVPAKPIEFCQPRTKCEICDTVFVLDMHYAEHVKKCLLNNSM